MIIVLQSRTRSFYLLSTGNMALLDPYFFLCTQVRDTQSVRFFILTGAKDELAALVVHGEVDEQHGTLRLDRQSSQYSTIFSVVLGRSVGTVGNFSAPRIFHVRLGCQFFMLLFPYCSVQYIYCKKGMWFSRPQPGCH